VAVSTDEFVIESVDEFVVESAAVPAVEFVIEFMTAILDSSEPRK
jgi:hypothetical protein